MVSNLRQISRHLQGPRIICGWKEVVELNDWWLMAQQDICPAGSPPADFRNGRDSRIMKPRDARPDFSIRRF